VIRIRNYTAVIVLCALFSARAAWAGVEVLVAAEDGIVYVDARATGLFEPDLDEALKSGLPARVEVEVILFERRAGLFDRTLRSTDWQVSVVFDLLDERYTVLDVAGVPILDTEDLVEVEEFVTGFEAWPLCPVDELGSGRTHSVEVEFRLEPLTIEEVRDLERWLRGNVREGSRLRDVPGQLVGILRNRLGLGGHSERGHSGRFRVSDLRSRDTDGVAADPDRD
jgi:hypothetical protein